MRRAAAFVAAALALVSTAVPVAAQARQSLRNSGATVITVTTKRTALRIPFHIKEVARIPAHQPVEVQLFVSVNRGATWNRAGSVPADANKRDYNIDYQASRDGEYLFCFRTRDASGNTHPAGPMSPMLRVVVDTAPPKLWADAWRGVDGQATVRWDASDPNLNPLSLKVACRRAGSNDAWQDIQVNHLLPGDARASYADSVQWNAAYPLEVRLEISDTAGNATQKVVVTGSVPSSSPANPSSPAGPAATPQPTSQTKPVPIGTLGAAGFNASSAATHPPSELPWQADRRDSTKPWLADEPQAPPLNARVLERGRLERPWAESPTAPLAGPAMPYPTATSDTSPARLRPLEDAALTSTANAAGDSVKTSDGRTPWLVNSTWFELAYDAGTQVPDELQSVEVWGTTDGGQSWRRVAIDEDRRSPAVVQVDAEGLHGFRLLISRKAGPVEFPPAQGTAPEMWVDVDRTEPKCHLTRADQLGNDLAIYWEASDRNLSQRPVTLKFSHRLGGPWRTMAAGLENTGRYTWPLPANLPAEIYLRLEVCDAADNVGVFTADKPITPHVPQPQTRLREAAPLAPARSTDRRGEPKMYYFR
jgi:hypothetical protein